LHAELRFWRPVLGLSDRLMLEDLDYASAFLAYSALPPDFDPRSQSMESSAPVLKDLGESLILLHRAGDDRLSVPYCLERAEKSAIFSKLLEFEEKPGAHSAEEFPPMIASDVMQVIMFGGCCLQVIGDPNLAATATISITLLRTGSYLEPTGLQHADPQLRDVVSELRLEELRDGLKPVRQAAAAHAKALGAGFA
jgi:hypothetical protein